MWWDNLILSILIWTNRREIKFRLWIELEEIKGKIVKAVREGHDDFPTHLLSFISTALHVNSKHFQDANWENIVQSFYKIIQRLPTIDLPIATPSGDSVSKRESWDYDGRTWHFYAHLLSSHYGWTLEYISQLQVGEALAKIQEILTDEQLDREFQYSLSEVAYPYDKNTKKSNFNPLPRPSWMRPKIKQVVMRKMPRINLPIGNVDYAAIPKEIQPKEIIH